MTRLSIDEAMRLAVGHHQGGRWAEAEGIYCQILAQVPDHADALHLLGALACQVGRTDLAIDLISRAIVSNPNVADYHSNLGESYRREGRYEAAIASISRAIHLKPDFADAQANLGMALRDAGRFDEAIVAYHRAIALRPDSAEIYYNLGTALENAGHFDEAVSAYRRAIAIQPDHAEAHNNLGNALRSAGRLEEAIAGYRRSIALRPDHAEAHNNLGTTLTDAGQFDEAIAALARAIALQPGLTEAHCNLGNALKGTGRLDEAIEAYHRSIALRPDYAKAHNNLGNVFKEQGRLDEALACFRRAVEAKPDFSVAASNLVFTLHYHPDYDAQTILAEHRAWASRFAVPLGAPIDRHANDRTPGRRLKIGFVSPDFRAHPVGLSLLALLAPLDRRKFEVVCYSDVKLADEVTQQLRGLTDEWRNIAGAADPLVAEQIRNDRVDILVDLALHTAGNRMPVFARKPAPVQVTMLGMPATTGLTAIDYRLTDAYLDPPDAGDDAYAERSIWMPRSFWCYQPPDGTPPVAPPPALANGFITFGCLNNFTKVSRPALQLWLNILLAVPDSRLLIQAPPGSHRDVIRRVFDEGGVAPARLDFAGKAQALDYFERFHELDLSLDPFPYNGHTSALDSLWMGVPVVTLAGRTAVGRGGVSILSNLGMPELIADEPQRYAEIAVDWARDRVRLAAARAHLRERLRRSPLMDGPGYAADVGAIFHRIWEAWCGQ